jgi:hypothetical protein
MPREGLDIGRVVSVIERLKLENNAAGVGGGFDQTAFCGKVPAATPAAASAEQKSPCLAGTSSRECAY